MPTLTVTPGTGQTVNTLQPPGQATPANSHPFTLDTSVETAPGAAGALAVTVQGNASGIALPSVLTAAEAHIGATGGEAVHVTATPANSAAFAYAAGNCLGGPVTIANFVRVAGRSVFIQSAALRVLDIITSEIDVYIFRGPPTVFTGLVDKAAFSIAAVDIPLFSKLIKFTAYDTLNASAVASNIENIGKYMNLVSGTSAYVQFVARGPMTLAGTTDITLSLGMIAD